jgi:hypothetical protein
LLIWLPAQASVMHISLKRYNIVVMNIEDMTYAFI